MTSRMACHREKWRRGKISPSQEAIANTPLLDIAWLTLAFIRNERVGDHHLGRPWWRRATPLGQHHARQEARDGQEAVKP
jgi:hypothetical protein